MASFGEGDTHGKYSEELSTQPFLDKLKSLLHADLDSSLVDSASDSVFIPDILGTSLNFSLYHFPNTSLFLLENIRFYPEDHNKNPCFPALIARNYDIYVNDDEETSFSDEYISVYQNVAIHFNQKLCGFSLRSKIYETLSKNNTNKTLADLVNEQPVLQYLDFIESER
jgi:3-phosphoglycerate kinase